MKIKLNKESVIRSYVKAQLMQLLIGIVAVVALILIGKFLFTISEVGNQRFAIALIFYMAVCIVVFSTIDLLIENYKKFIKKIRKYNGF